MWSPFTREVQYFYPITPLLKVSKQIPNTQWQLKISKQIPNTQWQQVILKCNKCKYHPTETKYSSCASLTTVTDLELPSNFLWSGRAEIPKERTLCIKVSVMCDAANPSSFQSRDVLHNPLGCRVSPATSLQERSLQAALPWHLRSLAFIYQCSRKFS